MRQQAIAPSGFRIELRNVGERKDIHGIEEARKRTCCSGRQRKPIVKAAAAAACDMRHHSIEHLAMTLVLVESIVKIRPKESAALRNSECNSALHRPWIQGKLGRRPVLQ